MTWFRIDDGFMQHPKVVLLRAGPAYRVALSLWFECGVWCAKHLTDGIVPRAQVLVHTRSQVAIRELLRVELWSQLNPDHYQYHDWLDYQPSKAQVLQTRYKTNQRVRRFRNPVSGVVTLDPRNADRNGSGNPVGNPVGNSVGNDAPDPGSRFKISDHAAAALDLRGGLGGATESGGGVIFRDREQTEKSELQTALLDVARERFPVPDGIATERALRALEGWLTLNHAGDSLGVFERLVGAFSRDEWALANGHPLADLAKRPERYLSPAALMEAKQVAAGKALQDGDVAKWREIQAEIRTLRGGVNGTR